MFDRNNARRAGAQSGFGLVELLIATMVLAFALMGFAAILGAAVRENVKGKKRTEAQQLATSAIEKLRGLEYTELATVGGNPAGAIPPVESVGRFNVKTKIGWVNDPVPGGTFVTYKDYKNVRVDVVEAATGRTWASMQTQFAPPGAPGQNEAVVKVDVIDAGNMPLSGVKLTLADGPSPTLTDTTDAAGKAVFPGLIANSGSGNPYVLTAQLDGYRTTDTDLPPNAPGQFEAAATSTVSKLLHMVRAYTINVTLTTESGTAFVNPTAPKACVPKLVARDLNPITSVNLESPMPTRPFTAYAVGGSDLVPATYAFSATCIPNNAVSGGLASGGTPLAGAQGWFSGRFETAFAATDTPGEIRPVPLTIASYPLARAMFLVRKGGPAVWTPVPNAKVVLKGGPANIDLIGTTNAGGIVVFYAPASPGSGDDYTLEIADSAGVPITTPWTTRAATAVTPVKVDIP